MKKKRQTMVGTRQSPCPKKRCLSSPTTSDDKRSKALRASASKEEENPSWADDQMLTGQLKESDGSCDDSILESVVIDPTVPFNKKSPLWETIESMEVLKSMKQQPHFHPLKQFHEELREGIAIGYMMNFNNLAMATRRAQFDEPKRVFEDRLKVLEDFNAHGFHVEPLQGRLVELLRVKDTQAQLEESIKVFEKKLTEGRLEEEKLKAEVAECKKKLKQLHECLTELTKKKETSTIQVDELQKTVGAINKNIRHTMLEFASVAAAPY